MVGFLFGGNTGETADSLARKRQVIEAMQAQIMGTTPRNAAEGWGALIKGIGTGIGKFRLGQQEKAGTAEIGKTFEDVAKSFFNRGNTVTPPVVSNELSKSSPTANAGVSGGSIYDDFIGAVKGGGVTNPNALAAIAATGRAESGFDPKKANARWSDPSQSGQAGTSGGILSWRNDRLSALEQFAQANGEDPRNISAATQARFFLQEDPRLIESLNGAKSVEEAQGLMNNAWKFAGYNQPSQESARRLGYAREYASQFQPTETASLDPSVGLPAADQRGGEWLRYANSGAARSQPISGDLQSALSFLPEMGIQMEVFSGGQPGKGENGPRTGSTRHDHGGAADVFFYKDGRRLDWNNPDDVPVFQEIVRRGKANGVTGFGAGDGYMQPGSMHIGFGAPAVWGAGGKGANAADWLRSAYASADQPTGGQQAIASIMPEQETVLEPIKRKAGMITADDLPGINSPFVPADIKRAVGAGFVPGGTAQGEGMERARRGNPNSPFIPRDMRPATQEVAQAADVGQGQGIDPRLYKIIASPFTPADMKAAARGMIEQQMQEMQTQREEQQWRARQDYERQQQESDPLRQLQIRKAERELATPGGDVKVVGNRLMRVSEDGSVTDVTPTGGPETVDFDDVSSVRKEIQQLPSYKNLSQALPIYRSMQETAGRDSKASDLNLVYGLGKIMDPTSVVREGEMIMVKNTASLPDWLQGAIASLNGGAALSPETRQAIMTEAYGRVQGYDQAWQQDSQFYNGIVGRNRMNREDVIPNFGTYDPWKAPTDGATTRQAEMPSGFPGTPDDWKFMDESEKRLWQN